MPKKKNTKQRAKGMRGYTLIEVLVVVVILAILAGIVVGVAPAMAKRAKRSGLMTALSTLQSAVDRFYMESNAYPVGTQPTVCPEGRQIKLDAIDGSGKKFLDNYIRFAPESNAANLGLDPAGGTTVYYGVTVHGRVFATQTPPDASGGWTDGAILVWVQNKWYAPITLADACYGVGTQLTANTVSSIILYASSTESTPGTPITVTGKVIDSKGAGVPNVPIRITISGSVTGIKTVDVISGADGTFSTNVDTTVPEYIVVTASTI